MAGTRRRRIAHRHIGISEKALEAWRAGDYWGLWRELGLRLWQMPDWDEDPPGTDNRPASLRRAYPAPDVAACKAALIELAGPPPQRWFYRNG